MIQRRVSAGPITSSISKSETLLSTLPRSYMPATVSSSFRSRGRVGDGGELVPLAELHGALEPHAPELAGGPGHSKERGVEAPAGQSEGNIKPVLRPELNWHSGNEPCPTVGRSCQNAHAESTWPLPAEGGRGA
jgi:hypothetical protein